MQNCSPYNLITSKKGVEFYSHFCYNVCIKSFLVYKGFLGEVMIIPVICSGSGCVVKKPEQKSQKLKFQQNPTFSVKEGYVGCEKIQSKNVNPYFSVLGSIAFMLGTLLLLGFGKKAI